MRLNIRPRLSAIALLVMIVVCSGSAVAQQNNSTADNAQATEPELREKAFKLLESLAGQISTLQSPENRARLGSNIAGSLWSHDEKRARALLVSVEEDIKAGLQNLDSEDREDLQTLRVFLQLRVDTVERIAKHDAEAALAFLKATELISDKPLPYNVAENERALELRLAKRIAFTNPDVALKLGRHSLARGFSHDLLSLLKTLNRKHKEQALIFYKEIILKLRNANLARDWQATYFATNLAQNFTPPIADESTYKELINVFTAAAEANGCGKKVPEHDELREFCAQVESVIGQMEKIDTSRGRHDSLRDAFEELNELAQNATAEEILALAQKYPQLESEIYWRAMMKAEEAGDAELARKIATEYRGDPEQQKRMLAQLDDQIWPLMDDEKLAEVLKRINTIARVEQRLMLMLALASQIGGSDRKTALKLLNQASGIIETMKPGKEQTAAQIALAMRYCLEKSDRCLTIMESVVPKLNDLVAAAMKLDSYDNSYVREGEWNMTGEGGLGKLLTQLAHTADFFAWYDFDRAVSLAAQFERPEIRFMAQLKLAQGILAGPPKRHLVANAPVP